MGSHVEAIGTCILTLSSGFVLKLERTFYVPSFSRNLISVSRLYHLDIPLILKTHHFVYYINLIVLGMVFCLTVFTVFYYKMIILKVQCMFTLALRGVILMRTPLYYDIGD